MKIAKYHISHHWLALLLFCFLFVVENTHAQSSFSLYVGNSRIIVAPDPPRGAIYQTAWGCSHASVSVSKYGTYAATVTVNSYFTGSAQIQCDYYWQYDLNNRTYMQHATTYFTVTCNPVTLSLNASNITLNPGGSYSLSYSLSPNITPTPTIRFVSDNTNVATVSQNGVVYAVGSGSATITVKNSAGPDKTCSVTVRNVAVQSVSIPSDIYVTVDKQTTQSASLYPSNAVAQSINWYIQDGTNYISLSTSGILLGTNPGTAHIYCMVNGNIKSNVATVHVSEPAFSVTRTYPTSNATEINAFITPSVTFSLPIYQGTNFPNISLKDSYGADVDGNVIINGQIISFSPSKPLKELTGYSFSIPANAVKNKWETHYTTALSVPFTTGEYQQLTLSTSLPSGFVEYGSSISLETNINGVTIYYTTDGTLPDTTSNVYNGVIPITQDIQLRAVAVAEGYRQSDVLSVNYYLTEISLLQVFPVNENKMFSYKDVNPYALFNTKILGSENIENVQLLKNYLELVDCEIIVADSSIYIVPDEPMEDACTYSVSIPANAIKTLRGEPNEALTWSFKTTNYTVALATGSPELGCAMYLDGSLMTWGNRFVSGTTSNGSYSMSLMSVPSLFIDSNVQTVSSGYMHHALIKNDNSLWMWGRQYCGEFGNNSTTGSATPKQVANDVVAVSCGGQSTAIIKNDSSLWMCGRNDYGQIGDSSVEYRSVPVKVMDNVSSVAAGWCVTYAITTDGSLWAWGRNDKYQLCTDTITQSLLPIKIMEDVSSVATSATEGRWTAVIKTDGCLWLWGETMPTPNLILTDVSSVSVGEDYVMAIRNDSSLWAWGNNSFGQLGNGTIIDANLPVKIMENVSSVVAGGQTTIALRIDGSVWSWGRNYLGTLGDGSMPSKGAFRATPTQIIEGKPVANLQNINARKQVYRMQKEKKNVVIATPYPLDAVYNLISWRSMNDSIVSVSERGVLLANNDGETDVIVTIMEGGMQYNSLCHVIVGDTIPTDTTDNTATETKYVVIFQDEDGTLLQIDTLEYDTLPVYRGTTPTKPATAQYTYTFAGWSPAVVTVSGEATYVATYTSTVNKYVVTFLDENQSLLQCDTLDYGAMPAFRGAEPAIEANAQYTYVFAGWSPTITEVTGATIYTAIFDSIVNKYIIQFLNDDSTLLQIDTLEYGMLPEFRDSVPTRETDSLYTYIFDGWAPEIVPVREDAVYVATYRTLTTDIPSVPTDKQPRKVLINGKMYIIMPDGTRYSTTGKKVQ